MLVEYLFRPMVLADRLAGEATMAQFWTWSGKKKAETPKQLQARMDYIVRKYRQKRKCYEALLQKCAVPASQGWTRWHDTPRA